MPPGLPNRPPLAMRLWLSRSFGKRSGGAGTSTAESGRASGLTMSIESLEHMVRSRVRTFLRHTWLVAILGTIVLVASVWTAFYFTTKSDHMRIAADPLDAQFVNVLTDAIAKGHHDLSLQLVPTNGVEDTLEAMKKGEVDLAILPATADDSLNWPVIAILRENVMALIVPAPGPQKRGKKSGKIEKIGDLAGRRIGIVSGSEASEKLLRLVLNHYGVPLAKVTLSEIDPKYLATAIKLNQVDALFVAGSATGHAISSAVAAATYNGDAPTFLEIDQADGIAKRNPNLDSVDIDAGTFGGKPPMPDDSLKSLSFGQYLVARKSFSETVIATLSRLIYNSRQSFAAALPGEIKITAPSTDKDADVVAHSGTLAYLNDSQQSFFDKYGDDIFYGMLIFPVFGSAIAGVASYLRSDTRTRRLRLLQRALDLVRRAHVAPTLEVIENLQVEADNLVIAIIHQSEQQEFDESVRMSFEFALDQLRFAIAARRHVIVDRAAAGTSVGGGQIAVAAPAAIAGPTTGTGTPPGPAGAARPPRRKRGGVIPSSHKFRAFVRITGQFPAHDRRHARPRRAHASRAIEDGVRRGCDHARRHRATVVELRAGPSADHPWRAIRRRRGQFGNGLGTCRPAVAHAGRSRDHRQFSRHHQWRSSSTPCRNRILPPRCCSTNCRPVRIFFIG